MHTALQKIIVSAVIIMLTVDNITSIITGETEVNGTYGSNVNITWKVTSTAGERLLLEIYVNKISIENQLLVITSPTPPVTSTGFKNGQSTNDVARRSNAVYYPTGNFGGMVDEEVVLTIRNLQLDDSNEYILQDIKNQKIKTVLSVNSLPVLSGDDLSEKYNTKSGEDFILKLTFLGNPQPEVKWTLDGVSILKTETKKINPYNYTYTVTIEAENLPKPCSSKQLNYTATGYGGSVTGFTTIYGGFSEDKRIAGGVCAGHIVGFEVGVILICVFIYLYLVVWGATKEAGKLAGFIIALVAGAGFIIGFAVAYGALRKTSENDDCNEGSIALKVCDNAFIAMGVIDFIVLLVVTLVSVKLLKDFRTKPSDQPPESEEKTPLNTKANKSSKGDNVKAKDSSSRDEEPRTEV